jgi:hypothetical protein
MGFLGLTELAFLAGALVFLGFIGTRLHDHRYLALWTVLMAPVWLIALVILRPLFWSMEGDYGEGGAAPWGAYVIGVPLGVFSFATALPLGSAWASRMLRGSRNSKHSHDIEEG